MSCFKLTFRSETLLNLIEQLLKHLKSFYAWKHQEFRPCWLVGGGNKAFIYTVDDFQLPLVH